MIENEISLSLNELQHHYPIPGRPAAESRLVLDIPAWQLPAGAQVLVRGVSGSGKTTLFNIIAGLLQPTAGSVQVEGQDVYALAEGQRDRWRAGRIGYVFQNHHLLPGLTALENVVMPLAFARRYPQSEWRERARSLLAHMGLADHVHYRPAQLSVGQRLRVTVARALVNEPVLLLADEPTAALDAAAAAVVMDALQATCRQQNAVLLLASHDPALDIRFTHTVNLQEGLLVDGRIPA